MVLPYYPNRYIIYFMALIKNVRTLILFISLRQLSFPVNAIDVSYSSLTLCSLALNLAIRHARHF
jgi:hypothetical protein